MNPFSRDPVLPMLRAGRWVVLAVIASAAACAGEAVDEDVDVSADSLVGAITRSFQNGVAPSSAYAGTKDTYIDEASPTSTHGSAAADRVDGDTTSGRDQTTLLSWNVGAIPAGGVVRSAAITLNVTNATAGTFEVFALKRAWNEGAASWKLASAGTAWAAPGATGTADRGTTVLATLAPRATGPYTVALNAAGVAVVQGWIDRPTTNYGFVIANTSNADALVFASSEATTASRRPKLSIGFDPAGTSTDGGTTTLDSGTGAGTDGGTAPPPATGATDANLKVAFIGDTASGANFKSVLQLVKREGADMVMIQGDLTYDGATGAQWFSAIDSELDTATVRIPYFVAKGNHDDSWSSSLGPGLRDRLTKWGITPDHNDPTDGNYSVTYRGLKMVMVPDSETSPTRASYVNDRLATDAHIWKICSWHKNQRATNVGPKNDEMGWQIYENCRSHGAMVAQGHSHTYSRSKTIVNDTNQTVDSSCSGPFDLCVAAGKHVFFDSSLGGVDTRALNTTIASNPYWGATYSGSFGALFVEFNVGGNPRKATGYFKSIGGTTIDPPASSGRATFSITSEN